MFFLVITYMKIKFLEINNSCLTKILTILNKIYLKNVSSTFKIILIKCHPRDISSDEIVSYPNVFRFSDYKK